MVINFKIFASSLSIFLLVTQIVIADDVKLRTLLSEIKGEISDSTVTIAVDAINSNLDPIKARYYNYIGYGQHLESDSKDILKRHLKNYPVIKVPKMSIDLKKIKVCDFIGIIKVEPKNKKYYYILKFDYLDQVIFEQISKQTNKPIKKNMTIYRWLDSERMLVMIGESQMLYRKSLLPPKLKKLMNEEEKIEQ